MKLKKLANIIDWLTDVVIWTPDSISDEEPAFEGVWMDIPFFYMDMKIGRPDGDTDEPIYIYADKNGKAKMVINLIENEEPKTSPTCSEHNKCNQCKYYEGVHNCPGHAPCSYLNCNVMWDGYCSHFKSEVEK